MAHRKPTLNDLFLFLLPLLFLSSIPRLVAAPAAKPTFEVKPTILFVQEKGTLKQRLDVLIDNPGPAVS